MNNIEEIVDILERGQRPSRSECSFFVNQVFSGGVDRDVITKILRLFNNVGFDAPQLSGFAESMRKASKKVICKKNIVDNCGTGGDAMHTFNISTTSSLIASCCEVSVAKHGNKSITSNSGSADLLSGVGIKINLTPEAVSNCIEKLNFGFMFAPLLDSLSLQISSKIDAEAKQVIFSE